MAKPSACEGTCITPQCSPSGACFDRKAQYRYALWRRWSNEPLIGFVLLNPSTADAVSSDRTMTRVQSFAMSFGHGGFYIVNAFAMITTDPQALREVPSRAIGLDNDKHLAQLRKAVNRTILGWGNFIANKEFAGRRNALREIIGVDALALGFTKGKHPRHPLYVPASAKFVPYEW